MPTSPESSNDLPLPRVSDLEPGQLQPGRMPKQRNEVGAPKRETVTGGSTEVARRW